MDQADVIQNMVTGKTAHVMMVIAAWSQMDDPHEVGRRRQDRIRAAAARAGPADRRPALGHWLGGVAKNVPDDRKRATVEFLRWFQTKEAQMATAQGRRHPGQRRDLSRADRARSAVPLDEAARRGAAARRQHL